jgi:hypothetical protein
MKTRTMLALLAMLVLPALPLVGCKSHEDGPLEKAGEKLDKAGEKIKDAVDPKGPAEKAGEKVDKALGN